MKSVEQIESRILRFPAIARETGSVAAFSARIDEDMEAIMPGSESEGALGEIEVRYEDLVEMANEVTGSGSLPDRA